MLTRTIKAKVYVDGVDISAHIQSVTFDPESRPVSIFRLGDDDDQMSTPPYAGGT